MSARQFFSHYRLLICAAVLLLISLIPAQIPTLAVATPYALTGTIDTSDPAFATDKVLLNCTGVWTGTNWHYELRTITVDKSISLNIFDLHNTDAMDVKYGVYDVTTTPFNASNLPLTSQCLGAATNNLNVSLNPGRTYVLVIANFAAAAGGNYEVQLNSTDTSVNLVVGDPGGTAPTPATVTSIMSTAVNGNYGPGATISIQVNFSKPVAYSSTGNYMTLTLNNGGLATCTYCNAYPTPLSSTYTFTYNVGFDQTTNDLDVASAAALALNGGTLQDAGGTTANITLPSGGTSGSLGANKALVTLTPTLNINNVTVTEGSIGPVTATFTVTLSASLTAPTVTVDYATANGTATAGADYMVASGTLTFAPGTTTRTVAVVVNGDWLDEATETFTVTLSGADNASVATASGTGTITDDDPTPSIGIGNTIVTEGNTGTVTATFTVTLSAVSGRIVTVNYATANTTATAGADYTATTGMLSFAAGTTTQTINVTVNGDTLDEANETFTVTLSGASNASITTASGTGTITDDDPTPTIGLNNATVTEGNSGTVTATFTVTLSAASGQTITVNYATANGTATAATDYTAASGTLTFAPGTTTQTINVTVNGDTLDEANETFTVTLSGANNASITTASGTGTITDDDPTPTIGLNNATVTEDNSGTVTATFTVTLSAASGRTVTVSYATADLTATAGTDYTAASGTLTFAPGTTTQTINVTVNGDTLDEIDETFTVTLSNATAATIATATGTGTITDDDAAPTLSINSVTVTEGNTGTVPATFTVTLSGASGKTVTVNYATANGTATAGTDYTAASGTLTFAPGETTKTVNVTVNGDTLDEANETFSLSLATPTGATIVTANGTGTITDNDPRPLLSFGSPTVTEGNAGTTTATFTLSLSAASGQTIIVHYTTQDIFATQNRAATAGTDYVATIGMVTFAPGETTKTVDVTVNGDTLNEADEIFLFRETTLVNVDSTNIGLGTIANDDLAPSLSINNATVTEGNSGTITASFTATLSAASGQTVTVNYATDNGTATAGADYAAASGTLTFAPGTTTQTINVTVNGDTLDEIDETFTVTLSNATAATVVTATGTGTITDDDAAPSLSINNATVTEGDTGKVTASFTATLSADSGQTVTVNYATTDGTAIAGADYTAASGTLTFAAGTTTQTINVTVNGDTLDEIDETFTVTLSNATAATIATATSTGTITDDDAAPSLSVNNATVNEGNTGTVTANFTVSLSATSGQTVTVNYATADGTATAEADYTAVSGTLTFAAGTTTQTINVTVNGDTLDEIDETFTVTLSGETNATIATATGTGTITDDDAAPSLSIGNATVTEGNAGTTTATFTVTLSAASGQTVTVSYASADGTATAGTDYSAASGTLTFTPGTTTQTITIDVVGAVMFEGDETFTVNLSGAINAAITTATGTGIITNDDTIPSVSIDDVSGAEGNAGTSTVTFTVSLSSPSSQTISVDFATSDGTAAAGSDYIATTATVTFTPGSVSQTMNVTLNGDALHEPDETYFVNLANAVNATIADNQGLGTITNDDAVPSVSVNDVSIVEGNVGTSVMTFTITLSAVSGQPVTVNYTTTDGTAAAGSDYVATSGTLTFNPGTTNQTVGVTLNGDSVFETDEVFTLDLNTPTNATIGDGQSAGTITNDDGQPVFSIDDVTQTEGDSDTSTFTFTVTRSGNTDNTDTVDFATADYTSLTADNDYMAAAGTLTFAVGVTTQTIDITVNGDVIAEADEIFRVNLSNASTPAVVADGEGIGTIQNDETAPGLSVDDPILAETAASGQFTVTLTPANSVAVSVDFTIADGTAVEGTDYAAMLTGTLNFAPGDTALIIPFNLIDNTIVDGNRTFTVTLSNSSSITIVNAIGVATITDDEVPVAVFELPAPPPATACKDVNFEEDGDIRTNFTNDVDRPELHCRLIASDGNYMTWYGSPLTSSANVGNGSVIDLGIIGAVDVFSTTGVTGFAGDVNVCLKGSGYIIYLNANSAPRVPQLWSAWTTDAFPGYTCTTLYAPGTVVLVQHMP